MSVEVLASIRFKAASGLPQDEVVNDLAFKAADTTSTVLNGIGASIESFFNTNNTTHPVDWYLGSQLSRDTDGVAVDFYDVHAHLNGSAHGSPVHSYHFTLNDGSTDGNYPSEVSAVITFAASGYLTVPEVQTNPTPPPAQIRPRARYRGRIYLGPLVRLTGDPDVNNEPRPRVDTFLTDLNVAAARFMDERGLDFAVWSRADATMRLVSPSGVWWADNAFDTQRRRGPEATARTGLWP